MVKLKGNKKSKRTKLSLKYNIQKRVREHKRRVRKEAKKLGVKKRKGKDPGIPNTWPYKAEMLQEMERKQEQREKELAERKDEAKKKSKQDREDQEAQAREMAKAREEERKAKRAEEVLKSQKEMLRRNLLKTQVLLMVLDARDPLGCRCAALEAWAKEAEKRVIFVLTKADTVTAQVLAQWLQFLGREGPAIAVQAEGGREGVKELLQLLGYVEGGSPPPSVGMVGYPDVGKKTLIRAMRRETKGQTRWLPESPGRLRATHEEYGTLLKLHLTLRGALRQTTRVDPVQTIRHLLERADSASVMRRFRISCYDSGDEFLRIYARDRHLKNKKGNDAGLLFAARRLIAELPALPGCFCIPPDAPLADSSVNFWAAHGEARTAFETAMQAQIAALNDRGIGPTTLAVRIRSAGLGPEVDIKGALAESVIDTLEEAADEEFSADEEEEEEDQEGADEEMLEGEESEEEGEDEDEDM